VAGEHDDRHVEFRAVLRPPHQAHEAEAIQGDMFRSRITSSAGTYRSSLKASAPSVAA
jgi:hypothetical protein